MNYTTGKCVSAIAFTLSGWVFGIMFNINVVSLADFLTAGIFNLKNLDLWAANWIIIENILLMSFSVRLYLIAIRSSDDEKIYHELFDGIGLVYTILQRFMICFGLLMLAFMQPTSPLWPGMMITFWTLAVKLLVMLFIYLWYPTVETITFPQ